MSGVGEKVFEAAEEGKLQELTRLLRDHPDLDINEYMNVYGM